MYIRERSYLDIKLQLRRIEDLAYKRWSPRNHRRLLRATRIAERYFWMLKECGLHKGLNRCERTVFYRVSEGEYAFMKACEAAALEWNKVGDEIFGA